MILFVSISVMLLFLGVGVETNLVVLGAILLNKLVFVVPISFGVGAREGVAFTLYPVFGVKIEMALAVSILFGVVMIIVGLIGG